jgi:hypothetical protein
VVAFAPLLLLAVYLPGEMMLRCRIDGLLRPACCCPHQAEPAQESGPVVKAQDCCAREMSTNDRPVVELDQRAAGPVLSPPSLLAVLPSTSPLAEPARSALTWQAHGPPGEGPPIVLLKHAFLI